MYKIVKKNTFIALTFLLFVLHLKANDKNVLFISSYHPSFPTFYQQVDGIKSVFDSTNILVDVEFMDSKRYSNLENKNNFKRSLFYKLQKSPDYDAIITSDDNALNFVLENKDSLFANIPIVFSGVNNVAIALAQNKDDLVTGVVESVSMGETILLMNNLFSNADSIYAIVDNTPSGQADLKTYYSFENDFADIHFEQINLSELSFHEFSEKLESINPNNPVLLLSAYNDKHGNSIDFNESLKFIKKHLSAPLFHLWFHGLGDGVLGGKLISHYYQAKTAAEITKGIMEGKSISDIPVVEKSPNMFYFDYDELIKYAIDKKSLPKPHQIINNPDSFYARNKNLLVSIGIIITILLIFILVLAINNVTRRRVEEKLQILNEDYKKQNYLLQNAIKIAETNELRLSHLFLFYIYPSISQRPPADYHSDSSFVWNKLTQVIPHHQHS